MSDVVAQVESPARAELDAWRAALPSDMASFPDCQVKAAIWTAFVDTIAPDVVEAVARAVPEVVQPLVRGAYPSSNWVPEVHLQLASMEVHARAFATHEAFYAFTLDLNRRILRSPLYRALGALLSPQRMLKGAGMAWSRMHSGTSVSLTVERGDNLGHFTFNYPRGLYPPTFIRCFPTAAIAALEAGGGQRVDAKLVEMGDTRALFELRWLA